MYEMARIDSPAGCDWLMESLARRAVFSLSTVSVRTPLSSIASENERSRRATVESVGAYRTVL